jgi:hypothetical protein
MKRPSLTNRNKRGAALIIVLAFLVLLIGIVVAYLTRASTDRQLAHGTFNENRVDQLARSALDIVVGDLKQEIVAGSTPLPSPNPNNYPLIYQPTSNANMLPVRSGTPTPTISPDPFPTLIRRSYNSGGTPADPITSPGVPSRASQVNSTTDVSLNGRSISFARWNKHYLISRRAPIPPETANTVYTDPVSSFTSPDWVLVTRNGPAVQNSIGSGSSALNNSVASNTSYVVGRYAYAIYDEGGLLDANVAGYPYPSPSPAAYVQTIGRKGSAAYADLNTLLPVAQVNNIVGWRNYASTHPDGDFDTSGFTFGSSAGQNYLSLIAANTGFLTVATNLWKGRTDQAFVTRQQLLNFCFETGFSQNALQYLGTFSRELNRPAWSPTLNATDMGAASNGLLNVYAYKDNAANPSPSATPINRNLGTVRVTGTFTRADGKQTVVGEPLLKTRFALTRLTGLGPSGVATGVNSTLINGVFSPASAATVQRDFGLLWNSGQNRWDYVGASGSTVQTTIERLDQVAAENREPNFFEILKAVILNGSVGLGSGSANTFVASELKYYITATTPANLLSADYQIMQIGANIIDAWDADNVPTFINFAGNELAGVENLPYLNKLVFTPFFPTPNGGDYFKAWLVPSLFNPHQNAASATGTIRVALTGGSNLTATGRANNDTTIATCTAITPLPATMDVSVANFSLPTPQKSAPSAYTAATVSTVGNPEGFWGFQYPFSASTTNATAIDQKNGSSANPSFGSGGNTVQLQIQIAGSWKTYQTWTVATAVGSTVQLKGVKQNIFNSNKLQDPEFVALDPRTVRFGVWASDAFDTGKNKKDYTDGGDDSMDQSKAALEQIFQLLPQGSNFVTTDSKANAYLYSVNSTAGADYYKDLDGVTRQGDWTTGDGTKHGSTVMYGSNSADRPQVLSAPLQSVAELGQVFRDQPWKTLAFTIGNSGDAGLLDAFTLQDVAMTAGRTSLNTRQSNVLAAILSQAAKNLTGSSIINLAQRDAIVMALTTLTATNPMISKGELVTRLAADASVTALGNKEARECVVRAFSDACQTRTWNLMIDVIAQSGRYPPNATSFTNGFVVEGEKRYWLHIAIDRLTGEIIDQQLEAVYD